MTKKAFTLIELLVVIAITGVLIAILAPAIGRARANARAALCCSNLRQIFLAAVLFSEDKGYYPRSYLTSAAVGYNIVPEPEFFPNYLDGDKEVLRCPEVKGYFNDDPPVYSYGWFWFKIGLASIGTVFPVFMESEASLVPMFTDHDMPAITNDYILGIYDKSPSGSTSPSYPCDFNGDGQINGLDAAPLSYFYSNPAYRHLNRANMIYLDGHIERVMPREEEPEEPEE